MAVVKWRKSSYSGTETDCVEVAAVSPRVAVRDSKNPAGPVLVFERVGFMSFVDRVKSGRLDLV